MEPQKLYLENGEAIKSCYCGKCKRLWPDAEDAERCCRFSYCGEFCSWERGNTTHPGCDREALGSSEQKRLNKAKLVADYGGPFLLNERVFHDIGELLDYVEEDELPEWGFCTKYQAPELRLQDLMECVADDMHEDWEPNDVPELAEAIEKWNQANQNNGTFYEDTERKWSKENLLAQHPDKESNVV